MLPWQQQLQLLDSVHLSRQLASTTSRHLHHLCSCLFRFTVLFPDSRTGSPEQMATEPGIITKSRFRCMLLRHHRQLQQQLLLYTFKASQRPQLQTATVTASKCSHRPPTPTTSTWQGDHCTNSELQDYNLPRCCPTRLRHRHSCKLPQLFTRPTQPLLPTTTRQQ